jgi:hypothetical protein
MKLDTAGRIGAALPQSWSPADRTRAQAGSQGAAHYQRELAAARQVAGMLPARVLAPWHAAGVAQVALRAGRDHTGVRDAIAGALPQLTGPLQLGGWALGRALEGALLAGRSWRDTDAALRAITPVATGLGDERARARLARASGLGARTAADATDIVRRSASAARTAGLDDWGTALVAQAALLGARPAARGAMAAQAITAAARTLQDLSLDADASLVLAGAAWADRSADDVARVLRDVAKLPATRTRDERNVAAVAALVSSHAAHVAGASVVEVERRWPGSDRFMDLVARTVGSDHLRSFVRMMEISEVEDATATLPIR